MKITVIGAGNMGGAIVEGAIKRSAVEAANVTVSDPSPQLAERLAREGVKVKYCAVNADAVAGADLIIVAVKPWTVEQVGREIAPFIDGSRQAIVSIAAGVAFARLEEFFSDGRQTTAGLFRVIPNTAIATGKSVTFVASRNASAKHAEQVRELFGALGAVFDIDESEMTACTALASSGIAYALRYVEAAVRGGEALGIDAARALEIVRKTVEGATSLLEAGGKFPDAEIAKVTTPGGITLKGLEAMERGGFSQSVVAGLMATK
ncbi:MAG: pyrroline-5-carboxylate reductase [Prevotellaceae bacterium]|jgi:pyrroline-5-carboxylate reductase|nr:pyrroline-5-carboxylate reductase [Prevotellaceae bacterium]